MTRKNSTVNPKAGTLKQENRALRITIKKLTVKLIAFALIIFVSIPNMSFVQDDTMMAVVNENAIRHQNDSPDSCCLAEKPGQRKTKVKLMIPSIEMIRKSDSEATTNLVYSINESKLKGLKKSFMKSDAEISKRFRNETSLDLVKIHQALQVDTHVTDLFKAENIKVNTAMTREAADMDMHDKFVANNVGISTSFANLAAADSEISIDFAFKTVMISIPDNSQILMADLEIKDQIQQIPDFQPNVFAKNGKNY